VEVRVELLSEEDLLARVRSGETQAYILGWQYILPSAELFLENVLHTKTDESGLFNGVGHC
jgi:hypothetical protein